MTPWQALDFCQSVINALGIERFTPREEGILVTKLAVMRTAACHHNRVWYQIKVTLDEVSSNWRQTVKRAQHRRVALLRLTQSEVTKKLRKRFLSWPKEDGVRVWKCFLWQRSYMETTQDHVTSFMPIMV